MFTFDVHKLACRIALFFTTMAAVSAFAVPITFIHTGVSGNGTVGLTPFENAAFTITSTGDTGDRASFSGGFFIDHLTSTINITGAGVFTVTTGTRTFVNQGSPIAGYSRAGISGADLYNGPVNAVFATWDMLTSIGPISGFINLIQWDLSPIMTNAGILFFVSEQTNGTFQAIVGTAVPEPASLALLGLGLAVLGLSRRKQA